MNRYQFGTEYEVILNELLEKDKDLLFLLVLLIYSYTKKGIIDMLRRDKNVKSAPCRFQDSEEVETVDVCICFDERVFDSVLEG